MKNKQSKPAKKKAEKKQVEVAVPWDVLVRSAEEARGRAHAPYSKYFVGAALLATDGKNAPVIYAGANLESASYPLCVCAERNAVAAAVFAGARTFLALAVATRGPEPAAPCGGCRQVLAEFAKDLPIALVAEGTIRATTTLAELLPRAFGGAMLQTVSTSE